MIEARVLMRAAFAFAVGVVLFLSSASTANSVKNVDAFGSLDNSKCNFNRVSVGAYGGKFAVWVDRKPLILRSNLFAKRSIVGIFTVDERPLFLEIDGEVSALNWRYGFDSIEMIINGDQYAVLYINELRLVVTDLNGRWGRINFKNYRLGGLSEAIGSYELANLVDGDKGIFRRFVGSILVEDNTRYLSSFLFGPDGKHLSGTFLFDFWEGTPDEIGKTSAGLDRSVRFARNVQNGHPIGRYSHFWFRGLGSGESVSVDFGLILDAAAFGNHIGLLVAESNNRRYARFFLRGTRGSAGRIVHICGSVSDKPRVQSKAVVFKEFGHHLAFLHLAGQNLTGRKLAIRFGGGPFRSVVDEFPASTTQMLSNAGFDVLEVDGIGSRARFTDQLGHPRITEPKVIRLSRAIRYWISRRRYDHIVIIGESFGSVAAMALAEQFSKSSKSVSLVLISPLTNLPAHRSMGGGPLLKGSLQYIAEYEAFGDVNERSALAAAVKRFAWSACQRPGLKVFVGSEDTNVPASIQADCIKKVQTIVNGSNHENIVRSPEIWNWLPK